MAFRDENEALRAKVRALQEEVESLQGELRGREAEPTAAPVALAEADIGHDPTDLAALVRKRELALRDAETRAAEHKRRKRDEKAARYADRPPRIAMDEAGGRRRIVIAPKLLRDQLYEQLGWGMGFAFVNPGVFIMVGLGVLFMETFELSAGWGVFAAITSWACLLFLINLAYAQIERRRILVDLTDDGHFAIYARRPKNPILLGRTTALEVRIDTADPSRLGSARFSDEHNGLEVDKLSARDLRALREILPSSD